jgi:YgiT-type zinc finger domain-containing protein
MKCVLCKQGATHPDHVTVTLQRGSTTIIIRDVPAEVCENCGEYYLADDVTGRVMRSAEDAVQKGVEVEILRYAA